MFLRYALAPVDLVSIPKEPRFHDSKYNSLETDPTEREREFEKDHREWVEEKRRIQYENRRREIYHKSATKVAHSQFIKDTEEWPEKKREAYSKFKRHHGKWERNQKKLANYESQIDKYEESYRKWERARKEAIEEWTFVSTGLKQGYESGNMESVGDLITRLLILSDYPTGFKKVIELEYIPATKSILLNYQLPSLSNLTLIESVRYVSSRDEYVEKEMPRTKINKLYDSYVYQIVLRSVNEIFQADYKAHIESVTFNGWIQSRNKATGKMESAVILSIQVTRAEIAEIELHHVDARECFRNLRGVSATKLSSITPVAPIARLNKSDSRFVDSYGIAEGMDSSTNLAAMDWEDFEHLIRELFEKEFASGGGEVKVTRASRDHGVDAIAFDPDPIRGGKIVIQAKRYTNPVGVSAVRDLYGTVMNEGAMKGILVTTSQYGPDAYSFAKNKPLTLLDGGNLLHMLGQHGYKAKIDIKDAKRILAEQEASRKSK